MNVFLAVKNGKSKTKIRVHARTYHAIHAIQVKVALLQMLILRVPNQSANVSLLMAKTLVILSMVNYGQINVSSQKSWKSPSQKSWKSPKIQRL